MYTTQLEHPKVFQSDEKGIQQAIEVLSSGGVAILPADTVYGFFASAVRKDSVERVYQAKRRERRKPFGIYTNRAKVDQLVEINDVAQTLIDQVWPKALSLILPKKPLIEDWFTHGNATLAVLTAQNRVLSRVIEAVGEPILGTTCNISGEPELKLAAEVMSFMDDVDLLITDDTIPIYNKPSTMINCTTTPPQIIRLSSLSLEELQQVIPDLQLNFAGRIS